MSLTPIQVAFTAKETIPVISAALDKTLRPKQVILVHRSPSTHARKGYPSCVNLPVK